MKSKKVKFWTGDIETGRGLSGKFLIGGLFDGKRYRSFADEDEFMYFIFGLEGVIFFHYLDFDIRIILAWCIRHGIEIKTVPAMSGDKKIVEWKICGVTFRDSFALTLSSLADLAESFNLKTRKLPMESHYFTHVTPKIRRYLRNDVVSLYEALTAFYRFVGWENFGKRTVASISLSKFKEIDCSSYESIIESPIYEKSEVFIRRALFGGYFETFSSEISAKEEIYKLDMNSYYAASMRDNLFPWGSSRETENPKEIREKIDSGEDLGIVRASAKVPAGLSIGFLPRKKNSGTDYPVRGIIKGCWTTPEIVMAESLGYIFEFESAILWRLKDYLFKRYVAEIGQTKERAHGAKRAIAKQLLVSLYGKFAERRKISFLRRTEKPIAGHIYLDRDFTIYEDTQYIRKKYSHPEISVFTTAYARMKFYKFCEEIGWTNIYAIISDSIIFRGRLTRKFRKRWIHASRIGKFKIVSRVEKAIILARGVYALRGTNGEEIVRNQGGLSQFNKLLTFADFEKITKNKKETWMQYKNEKRANTVYKFLTGQGKLRGKSTVARTIKVKR